ncbi:hypothetical protein POP15_298 [Pectobacterium phage POP15]|nr:hypothetical protein POP15_298 [Pectobacterium phage POP15]
MGEVNRIRDHLLDDFRVASIWALVWGLAPRITSLDPLLFWR